MVKTEGKGARSLLQVGTVRVLLSGFAHLASLLLLLLLIFIYN